jgi:hypothetical protein
MALKLELHLNTMENNHGKMLKAIEKVKSNQEVLV